jgi:transcriptional regulator with XRE-family HTH domain
MVGRPARRLSALRRLRESRVLSQAELAERAGVARATVVSLETGRAGAQYATIRKLAKALGIEPNELTTEPQDWRGSGGRPDERAGGLQ